MKKKTMTPKRKKFREHLDVPPTAIKIPRLPNFILLNSGGSIPVEEFSDVQLKLIAAKWAHQFLDHARIRRLARRSK